MFALSFVAGCGQQPEPPVVPTGLGHDDDGDGVLLEDGDCDDTDPRVSPLVPEICDGIDQDCDGEIDEGALLDLYVDEDGDGYGGTTTVQGCEGAGVAEGGDCDDADSTVFPGATETCNGVDDDCDGENDENVGTTWWADVDGDGYGDPASSAYTCSQPADSAANDDDCDDRDAAIHPDAEEVCDGIDQDCDDDADEDATNALTWYADDDADGYGDPDTTTQACDQPEGYVADSGDCDDGSAAANPEGVEICDGEDQDCDGLTDEEATDAPAWHADTDADGYGDASVVTYDCSQPSGYVADATDCDDAASTTFPGAAETCDDIDQDCDDETDEDAVDPATWYADGDGDGFGDATSTSAACDQPSGYVADATDCDDASSTTFPGANELCDDVDQDCDGELDEDAVDMADWYADADADGFGDPDVATAACDQPAGTVADDQDCDDADGSVNPNAVETCDGLDQDCDGEADEDATDALAWYTDADGDGWGDDGTAVQACVAPTDTLAAGGDCDDADPAVSPGADEICDGVDTNCDGTVPGDETSDADGDGTMDCADSVDGSALSFDGDDLVTVPGSSGIDFSSAFTVELWLRTTTSVSTEVGLVGQAACAAGSGWYLGLDGSHGSAPTVADLYAWGPDRVLDVVSLDDGAWHHLAGVWDGTDATLYVDGAVVATAGQAFGTAAPLDLVFGVQGSVGTCTGYYSGVMDEIAVFSSARTAAEIAADLSTPLTGLESGLQGYWPLDDLSGQAVADESANGRDATLGRSSSSESADPTWVEESPF
jgi:hypothetical protein